MYPTIDFLGRTLGTYSLAFVVGLLVCGFLGVLLGRVRKVEYYEDILLAMLFIAGGILIGGHLLYFIVSIVPTLRFLADTDGLSFLDRASVFFSAFGGSVFYGGLFGAIGSIFLCTKFIKTLKRSDIMDIFAVCVPLFHAFGRVGCFFGGCCFGIESKIGFTAHGNELVPMLNGVNRFPVQLLEAFLNLCIFVVVLSLFMKKKFTGELIVVYLFIYSIVRFCDEFLRGDVMRGRFLFFSTSQWISIFAFTFAVIYFVHIRPKKKKATLENT